MDAISDMSFNDDSVADSDYVPNSVDETTTDYSTDDDISKVATLINIKHARPVVHLGSSEVVESVGSPNAGPSSWMQDVEKSKLSDHGDYCCI